MSNDQKIQEIIEQLDQMVSKDGAVLVEGYIDSEQGGEFYEANRQGYLRLGIEFLKGAYAEPKQDMYSHTEKEPVDFIGIDLDYLVGYKACYQFARKEEIQHVIPDESDHGSDMSFRDKLGCALGVVVLLFLLASTFAGMGVVAAWLGGLVS